MKTTIGPFTVTTRRFDQRSAYTRYTISVRVDGEDVVLREQVSFVGAQECMDALNKAVERSVISADDAMAVLTDAGAMGVIPQPLPNQPKEMHSRVPSISQSISTGPSRNTLFSPDRAGPTATGFDRGRSAAAQDAQGDMLGGGSFRGGRFNQITREYSNDYAS